MNRFAPRGTLIAGLALVLAAPAAWAQRPPAPPPTRPQAAAPAGPQGLAEAMRGPWFAGDCTAPDGMAVVTARSVALLPGAPLGSEEAARLFRFRETRPLSGWTLGIAGGAEAPRLLLRRNGAELELAEPEAKTRDDRLPGEVEPEAWHRCPAPPAALLALHGEGIAMLATLENLEAACAPGPGPGPTPGLGACAAAFVQQGDVSGDGKLSTAELARLSRGAAWVAAVQDGAAPDGILAATGGGGLAGVLAARLLLESLDYDGDGKLSAAELSQDRLGIGRPGLAFGNPAGSPLPLEGLGEGAGLLRGLAEGLLGGH